MATTPWVMTDASSFLVIQDPDGTPVPTELCEYVRAIRLEGTAPEIDASTMCKSETLLGNPTFSCILAVVWSPEMYELFSPLVGQLLEFQYKADPAATKAWIWRGRFAFVPFGASELSAAIIPDFPVSVVGEPEFVAPS